MNESLKEALALLNALPLIANLGRIEAVPGGLFFENADRARASFESPEWAKFRLMIRNRNYRDVARGDHARFKEWDRLAQAAWSDVSGISRKIRDALTRGLSPSEPSLKTVEADVWAILFELVYADLCKTPVWGSRVMPILKNGNFPCGWTGTEIDERWAGASDDPLPDGKVLFY